MLWLLFLYITRIAKSSSICVPLDSPQTKLRIREFIANNFSVTISTRSSKFLQLCIFMFVSLTMCLGRTEGRVLEESTLVRTNVHTMTPSKLSEGFSLEKDEFTKSSDMDSEGGEMSQACFLCHLLKVYLNFAKQNKNYAAASLPHPTPSIVRNQKSKIPSSIQSNSRKRKYLKVRKWHEGKTEPIESRKTISETIRTFPLKIDQSTNSESLNSILRENEALPTAEKSRERRNIGDRRISRLYCRTGVILTIQHDGRVEGTHNSRDELGVMEIQSTDQVGFVRIHSQVTGRYLAMSKSGHLYGSTKYDPERSAFTERIDEGWYTTYSILRNSKSRKRMYVALSKHGKARKGKRTSKDNRSAHFLPRRIN